MTFQDIQNFTELKKNFPHKVAFAIPGLIGGFNTTILDGIEGIRVALGLEQIKLYIFTWNEPNNYKWNLKLQEVVKDYPGILIVQEIENYQSSSIVSGVKGLYNTLGIPSDEEVILDRYNTKRIVSLYAQFRLYKLIRDFEHKHPYLEQDNKTLIYKINPNVIFHPNDTKNTVGGYHKYSINKILHILLKHICTVGIHNIKHPYDFLYVGEASSTAVSDKMYASSIDTLSRLFGTTEDEFWGKLFKVYNYYFKKYPFKVQNSKELEIFGKDLTYFPIEGSVFLKKLIDLNEDTVHFYSSSLFGRHVKSFIRIVNPWPYIDFGMIRFKDSETWEFVEEVDKNTNIQFIL